MRKPIYRVLLWMLLCCLPFQSGCLALAAGAILGRMAGEAVDATSRQQEYDRRQQKLDRRELECERQRLEYERQRN